jgi:diguanylate cyclase (GGDEF)-like protein
VAAEAEKLAELLRAVPIGCLVVDAGTVVSANDEAVDETGVPRARLVGAPLGDLVLPEHQRRVDQLLAGVAGGTTRAEVRLAAGFRPVELTGRVLPSGVSVVVVRSMAREVELSAMAGGVLTHDQVTGLPNRYYLLEELHRRLHAPVARPLACLAIWIDDLQAVVAERGPRAADRILNQVAERLHGRLRAPDLLGRFDDNGFLVLLTSDMGTEQLTAVARRLREEIAFPVEHESALLSFTASMAVAPLGLRRPSVERLLSRLEAVARHAAASGGGHLDTLDL